MGPPPGKTAILSKTNFRQHAMASVREEPFSGTPHHPQPSGGLPRLELEWISRLDILIAREQ